MQEERLSNIAVSATSLNFSFGDTRVLRDINLRIDRGKFVSIIGPSGCGKSTLLFLLARLYAPNSGEIEVIKRELGLVFQEYNRVLLPWRTVKQNVTLYLELLRYGNKQEREKIALEHLSTVGLSGFEKHFPHQLSGGMKQRVQIARVLSTSPSVLLFDEPFGSLDSQTKELMQNELLRIFYSKRGLTAVFVTHDIEEATFLSDEIIVMGKRPSTIVGTVRVDIPHPRDSETRFTSKFNEIKHELWKRLRMVENR